jgi:hypothetical protein
MQSAWFGGSLMLAMIVGLAIWVWWAMKKNNE